MKYSLCYLVIKLEDLKSNQNRILRFKIESEYNHTSDGDSVRNPFNGGRVVLLFPTYVTLKLLPDLQSQALLVGHCLLTITTCSISLRMTCCSSINKSGEMDWLKKTFEQTPVISSFVLTHSHWHNNTYRLSRYFGSQLQHLQWSKLYMVDVSGWGSEQQDTLLN